MTGTRDDVRLFHVGVWRSVGAGDRGEDPADLPAERFGPLPGQFFLRTAGGIKSMDRIMAWKAEDQQERFHPFGRLSEGLLFFDDGMHHEVLEVFLTAAHLAS